MSALAQFDAEQEALAAKEMRKKGWVPYSERGPQTNDLNVLRAYLVEVRARIPRNLFECAEAYNRLAKAVSQAGTPLGGLRRYSKNEVERFFARTINGPDGHVYWNWGRDVFARNDEKVRPPSRWWWEHVHGPISSSTLRVRPTCGDAKCINVAHQECTQFQGRRHTDEQLLGYLQVACSRKGRAVSAREFDREGFAVTSSALKFRFGSWDAARKQAGIQGGATQAPVTPDSGIASILEAKNYLGRWPTTTDYKKDAALRRHLRTRGFPTTRNSISRELGSWPEALRKAGTP
jgi:hypothetical protein